MVQVKIFDVLKCTKDVSIREKVSQELEFFLTYENVARMLLVLEKKLYKSLRDDF